MLIKINNLTCRVETEREDYMLPFDVDDEIREFLSVKDPNAYYVRQRNPTYDGWRRFYIKKHFPTGFLPDVVEMLEELGVSVRLQDDRENLPEFDKVVTDIGVFDLNDRDHQPEIVESAITREFRGIAWPRGIADAATNAGKNSVIASLHLSQKDPSTLLLVHNRDIYKQAIAFFSKIFEVGTIQGKKFNLKPFTIAMSKSCLNRANDELEVRSYLNNVRTLIVDESHRAGSREYRELLTYIDAGARFCVSGTPMTGDVIRDFTLIGLTGTKFAKVSKKDMFDKGYSLRPTAYIFPNFPRVTERTAKAAKDTFIYQSIRRVRHMKMYAEAFPERTIVICVDFTTHGNFIAEHLGCETLYGPDKDRDEKIDRIRSGDLKIVVTTLLQEGINAPIDTIVYAKGGSSIISLSQYSGRAERLAGSTDEPHIIDWFDRHKWLLHHSKARCTFYESEDIPVVYLYDATPSGMPISNEFYFEFGENE